ncbi:MAG TPA: o-succinylbenzoate synthase [Desulfitobacterium dehalogenans]|uniref:o-succinylbenzoate synthase n=1 Tax=Desulfitobacterium dehalogenans TaxID=36854 RepID=A0A7C6Z3Y0_9FIRM|nr:o-succinylbenzoate synthase [Desulfitobacterium dehalogenans]
MRIERIEIFHLNMPMKFTFRTAQGTISQRETLVIKVTDELGNLGYGEVVAFNEPFYSSETLPFAQKVLLEELLPQLLNKEIDHPFEIHLGFRGNSPMAMAGIENALLDGFAKGQNKSMMKLLFNEETRKEIYGGMVLGDLELPILLEEIQENLQEGYVRFKIKIKPEDGFVKLNSIREHFPDLMLLADANRSFRKEDLPQLKRIDELGLACLEEPLESGDLSVYQDLQEQMATPICLDESIQTMADLREAIRLGACQVVNLKVGRVGGMAYMEHMIKACRKHKVKYWIGSMLESGISKILHVHCASLMDNYIPGDLSSTRRYFSKDVIQPEIAVQKGLIQVPQGPGLGVTIDQEALDYYTMESFILDRKICKNH